MPPRSRTAAVSALASYGGEESPVAGAMPAESPAPSACDVYAGALQSNTNPCRLDCNVELGALICDWPLAALAIALKWLNSKVLHQGVRIQANTQSSRNAVAARDGRHSNENSIGQPGSSEKGRHWLRKHWIQQPVHRHHIQALQFTELPDCLRGAETFSRGALAGFRRFFLLLLRRPASIPEGGCVHIPSDSDGSYGSWLEMAGRRVTAGFGLALPYPHCPSSLPSPWKGTAGCRAVMQTRRQVSNIGCAMSSELTADSGLADQSLCSPRAGPL
jgi:hypothetical protein